MKLPTWLERAGPVELGQFLSKTASSRKSGLFIRHLCRCFPELFIDPRSMAALDAADRYEAGELAADDFQAAIQAAVEAEAGTQVNFPAWEAVAGRIVRLVASQGYYPAVLSELRRGVLQRAARGAGPRKNPIARAMRPLFLEHFGDPHRPVTVDPSWLTPLVVGIARGCYQDRDYVAMPILGDALEDAGCDNADILDHCRSPQPHVRGCWVVDLCLGLS